MIATACRRTPASTPALLLPGTQFKHSVLSGGSVVISRTWPTARTQDRVSYSDGVSRTADLGGVE